MIARVQQESERHFEDLVHFVRVGSQLEGWRDHPDHGRYTVAGARVVFGEPAEKIDVRAIQADLFLRLAQRRRFRRVIRGRGTPARKADLSRVSLEMGGALSEEDRKPGIPGDDRNKDRSRREPLAAGTRTLVAVD